MAVRGQVKTENICTHAHVGVHAHSQQCRCEKSGDVAILWPLNVKASQIRLSTITPQEHIINTLRCEEA